VGVCNESCICNLVTGGLGRDCRRGWGARTDPAGVPFPFGACEIGVEVVLGVVVVGEVTTGEAAVVGKGICCDCLCCRAVVGALNESDRNGRAMFVVCVCARARMSCGEKPFNSRKLIQKRKKKKKKEKSQKISEKKWGLA
jgi:hypothetical protein